MGKCISKHPSTLALGLSEKDLSAANQIWSKFSDSAEYVALKHEKGNQLCDYDNADHCQQQQPQQQEQYGGDIDWQRDEQQQHQLQCKTKKSCPWLSGTTITTTTTTSDAKLKESTAAEEEVAEAAAIVKDDGSGNNNSANDCHAMLAASMRAAFKGEAKHCQSARHSSNNNAHEANQCSWAGNDIANNCHGDVQHCSDYLQLLQQFQQQQQQQHKQSVAVAIADIAGAKSGVSGSTAATVADTNNNNKTCQMHAAAAEKNTNNSLDNNNKECTCNNQHKVTKTKKKKNRNKLHLTNYFDGHNIDIEVSFPCG